MPLPEVDTHQDLRTVFSKLRQLSAHAETGRSVAVVTPGRLIMPVACPPANAVSLQMLEGVRRIAPETPKQQITVIANNNVVAASAFTAREANALIPFLGYLMGMAFDGHTVVVFEGVFRRRSSRLAKDRPCCLWTSRWSRICSPIGPRPRRRQ